jgi:hypothetical protein
MVPCLGKNSSNIPRRGVDGFFDPPGAGQGKEQLSGLPQDNAEAARWCRRAAEQGNPLASGHRGRRNPRGRTGLASWNEPWYGPNMSSIDDPIEAFLSQYPEQAKNIVGETTLEIASTLLLPLKIANTGSLWGLQAPAQKLVASPGSFGTLRDSLA